MLLVHNRPLTIGQVVLVGRQEVKEGSQGGISLSSGGGGGVAGSLWAALMGLLQLIVSFLTFIKNALTRVFSGGDQTSSTGSSGGRQTQRRYLITSI